MPTLSLPLREPIICPRLVHPLSLESFNSDLENYPFLSEEEKADPPAAQAWNEFLFPKLRRYPNCKEVWVNELIDDHGIEGFVFKVDIDGSGPFVLKVFKQVSLPPEPFIWPFRRECLYYSRAEAVNAGALSGKSLPLGPPPDSYTRMDLARFLRSFSSDQNGSDLGNPSSSNSDPQNDIQIHNILSEMDGSLGWIRLNRTDINKLIGKWDLDLGYTMEGRLFQVNPFGIVKKFVSANVPRDDLKIKQWMDLAAYMGYELNVFEPRNWVGSGTLVDAGDVLTLPVRGIKKGVAPYYSTSPRKLSSR